jgi:hypothetical protein
VETGSSCRNFKATGFIALVEILLLTKGALSVICLPALHAGEAIAVKSPAKAACVATNATLAAGDTFSSVRW